MKEGGERRNILVKTIDRCRSLGGRTRRPASSGAYAGSGFGGEGGRLGAVPAGFFTVLVGPEKERFAVRARCANHPLFRALLDQAETEYGFAGCDGPLELPCDVDTFMDAMWEMEQANPTASPRCGARFAAAAGSSRGYHHHHQGYQMMSPGPARFLVAGRS
ncbi:hypothetical protein GUJ93_ZPchr0002g24674 [Zizania palustris]|uniref:Uncharacterized protein n=1 Tax=Zizania palustris TaxID=103762 RepID=A0A8J5V4H7_ZIZPA|nr:hypothetical protein GUJ93_ZPchr0002g24674 [Zizania palustris]